MDNIKKLIKLKEKRLAKMGPDYVVIIPRNYIRNGLLDPEKRYNIEFVEVVVKDGH